MKQGGGLAEPVAAAAHETAFARDVADRVVVMDGGVRRAHPPWCSTTLSTADEGIPPQGRVVGTPPHPGGTGQLTRNLPAAIAGPGQSRLGCAAEPPVPPDESSPR